jgi:predicted nucleic-acid-binding protein
MLTPFLISKKLKSLVSIREDLVFEKNVVLYDADIYSSTSLDFVDCLLAGYFKIKKYSIFTFDKSLKLSSWFQCIWRERRL